MVVKKNVSMSSLAIVPFLLVVDIYGVVFLGVIMLSICLLLVVVVACIEGMLTFWVYQITLYWLCFSCVVFKHMIVSLMQLFKKLDRIFSL
jgi:hypothetical protein